MKLIRRQWHDRKKAKGTMDIFELRSFFFWCTIINGGLLVFWTAACVIAPDAVYRTQRKFFPLPKDVIMIVLYSFLAVYKIMFLVFNLVPYFALLIIS